MRAGRLTLTIETALRMRPTSPLNVMPLLEAALTCPQCVVSVIGVHAGEDVDVIFNRKKADIERTNRTFWVIRSPKAKPKEVQEIKENAAREYSTDRVAWHQLPEGLSPVTGKLDTGAAALVFDSIDTGVSGTLDLWGYAEFSGLQRPIRFILGCSTVCVVRKDMKAHPDKMKSRYRKIVAVARLAHPFCVWVR